MLFYNEFFLMLTIYLSNNIECDRADTYFGLKKTLMGFIILLRLKKYYVCLVCLSRNSMCNRVTNIK